MTTASMATAMPPAVVMSASEIPAATTVKPPCPVCAICRKACMMPTTVPKRPMKGAVAPTVPRIQRLRRSLRLTCCRSRSTAASIRSGVATRAPGRDGRAATIAARKTSAAGEPDRSHCVRASSRSPR